MLVLLTCVVLAAPLGELQAGPTHLTFVQSDTATVFHMVEQLSGWSDDGARRFASVLPEPLTDEDRRLLTRHGELRARVGWTVLHEAFAVEARIDDAAAAAVSKKLLSGRDADFEREVLHAFEARVLRWAQGRSSQLGTFVTRLQNERVRVARFITEASRFVGAAPRSLKVFLVPSMSGADGAAFAGAIVLEVPPAATDDPLLHEVWHAIAGARRAAFERAIARRPGLELDLLNEGLAYAVQPGLFPAEHTSGALELHVGRGMQGAPDTTRASNGRLLKMALAFRPSLRAAWKTGTLDDTLPVFAAIAEGYLELERAASVFPGQLVLLGEPVLRLPLSVEYKRLDPALLTSLKATTPLGIALLGQGPAELPDAFRALFGPRWRDIEQRANDASGSVEVLDGERLLFLWWERWPAGSRDGGASEAAERAALKDALRDRICASLFKATAAKFEAAMPGVADGGSSFREH